MNTTLRNIIKTVDSRLFFGLLRRCNKHKLKYLWHKKSQNIISNFEFNVDIYFSCKKQNQLGKLFDKYGSDKGYSLYTLDDIKQGNLVGSCYNDVYDLLFFQHKNKTKLVLECGIGTKNSTIDSNMSYYKHSIPGGSLRSWRDYFPNADIIGLDIDPDVMFTEDRINTFVCNQTSKSSINNFIKQANLKPNTVDIIIDDGLHEFNANITMFENTKHLLKDNGIYVIEDFEVGSKEYQKFIDYFKNLSSYDARFIRIANNYLIVITKQNI